MCGGRDTVVDWSLCRRTVPRNPQVAVTAFSIVLQFSPLLLHLMPWACANGLIW